MIEIALQPAKTIIEALTWTERYGGIARPLAIPQELEGGRIINKVFPVRKDLSADQCFRQNRMYDLVPNSIYANLVYFEQVGDFRQVNSENRAMAFAGRVRLVYWLNLPAMGIAEDGSNLVSGHVAAQLCKSLATCPTISSPFKANVEYSNFSILPTSDKIFSAYSYDQNVQALMLYPFDYGAIEFDVYLAFGKDCLESLPTGAAIECIAWS